MIRRRHYTVVELITVIVIFGLVSAMAVSRFRRMPAFLSLDSNVSSLKQLMARARNNAVCQGVNTRLVFNAEGRRFSVYQPQTGDESEGAGEEYAAVKASGLELYLPEEVEIRLNNEKLEDDFSEHTVFNFYPDGTGGGNIVTLQLEKHAFKISISPLSGTINAVEVEAVE